MDKTTKKEPTVEDLLQDFDQNASHKTYAQLAAETPESAGLKMLAQAEADGTLLCTMPLPKTSTASPEMQNLHGKHLDSGEPSPDYRMPETLKKILAFEAEISPLAPYLDGPKGSKEE